MPEDVREVIEKVLKEKELQETERYLFKEMPFVDVGKILADEFKMEFKPATVPRIITELYERAPRCFERLGIRVKPFTFKFRTNEITEEVWEKNIQTKTEFEKALDEYIAKSYKMRCVTTDLDIFGKRDDIKEVVGNDKLAVAYTDIGKMHEKSLKHALEDNKMELLMCMRVFGKDGSTPMAVNTALRLSELDGNIRIYDYDEGEKYGVISTYELINWEKHLDELMQNGKGTGDNIRDMSDITGLTQTILKELKAKNTKPAYPDARVLESYHRSNEKYKECRLVRTADVVYTIYRDFFPGWSSFIAERPQPHKEFFAFLIEDWGELARYINHNIDNNKPPEPVSKETLQRYAKR